MCNQCSRYRKSWRMKFFAAFAYLLTMVESKAYLKPSSQSVSTIDDGDYVDPAALQAINNAINEATENNISPSIQPMDQFLYPLGDYRGGVKKKRKPLHRNYEKHPKNASQSVVKESTTSDIQGVQKHAYNTKLTQMVVSTLKHLVTMMLLLPPFVLLYIMIPLKLLLGVKMIVLANMFTLGALAGKYILHHKHSSEEHGSASGYQTLQQLQSLVTSSGFPFWFPALLNTAGVFIGIGNSNTTNTNNNTNGTNGKDFISGPPVKVTKLKDSRFKMKTLTVNTRFSSANATLSSKGG